MKVLVSTIVILMLIGCGQIQNLNKPAPTPSFRINVTECEGERGPVCLASDPEDFILQGGKITVAAETVRVQITGALIEVKFESWVIQLFTNSGDDIRADWYPNAERYPFQKDGLPGISVAGEGRGCNSVAGAFEIRTYRRSATELVLNARLIQHCEKAESALYGWIQIGNKG